MTAITHAWQTLYNCLHFILCFDKLNPNGHASQCSSYNCRLPPSRRRRNSFACSVVNNWNRLPFSVASVTEQRKYKQLLDSYVYSYIFLFILFSPQYGLFWALCPFPISKYIHHGRFCQAIHSKHFQTIYFLHAQNPEFVIIKRIILGLAQLPERALIRLYDEIARANRICCICHLFLVFV